MEKTPSYTTVETGEMMGYTRADLEKARDDIYARREGESPLQQQSRIARAELLPLRKPKAPLASPEPIAWIRKTPSCDSTAS